jgi:hypothetical protein
MPISQRLPSQTMSAACALLAPCVICYGDLQVSAYYSPPALKLVPRLHNRSCFQ